jgi:tetratricopeptide (TPR) repeat protein
MSFDKRRTLQNALVYTQQGKWDRAIAEYLAIVKADPGDLTVCNNLGDLYARAGRLAEAIEQYRKLGESYRTDGLSVKAIAVYKKIAKLDPTWTAAYTACGDLYLEQGLVGEAKLQFATAAQLYAKAGETSKVVEIYQRLAQLDPANLSLLTKLADLLAKQGAPEAAAAEYERAAQAAEAAGQTADAKRLLKKARDLVPAARPTMADAERLLADGNAGAACEILARLTAEDAGKPQAWRLLAEAHSAQKRPDQALAALEQGSKHGLAEREVAGLYGEVLVALGRTEDAAALCDRVVEDALGRGEPDEAVARCTALLATAPSLLPIHRRLVEVLDGLGRDADALGARRALAEVCEHAGQVEAAVETYQAILARYPADEPARARLAALTSEPAVEAAPTPEGEAALGEFALLLEDPGQAEADGGPEPSVGSVEVSDLLTLTETEAPTPADIDRLRPSTAADAPSLESAPPAVELEAFSLNALSVDDTPAPGESAPPAVELEAFSLNALSADDAPAPVQAGEAPDEPAPAPEPAAAAPGTEAEIIPPAPTAPPEPATPAQTEAAAADFTLSGEGSLDFLGSSLGPGGRPVDEDDAPSGQAAEQLAEADVYLKYGLEDKARERLVEVVRLSPHSVTVRRKLKTLYRDQQEVEAACDQIAAIARILEERQRHDAARQEILEGLELMPGHTELRRLLEVPPEAEAPPAPPAPARDTAPGPQVPRVPPAGPPSGAVPPPPETASGQPDIVLEVAIPGVAGETPPSGALAGEPVPPRAQPTAGARLPVEQDLPPEVRALLNEPEEGGLVAETVSADGTDRLADDLAEAEFYLSQGMGEEARAVARRLQRGFPDEPAVAALVARVEGAPRKTGSLSSLIFREPAPQGGPEAASPATSEAETEDGAPAAPPAVFTVQDGEGRAGGFVDLRAELEKELEPDSPDAPRSEAALVNGLLTELQRGVREQVDAKDFETHYNLGIAYKEMDLYDEAIQEFRLAAADPKRVLECADLLGQCHLAKGQPQLAVAELAAGLEVPGHPAEAYRPLRYGLALAHEALGEDAAALEQLERLNSEDPRFRDVQGRLQSLRERSPRRTRVEPLPPAQPAAAGVPPAAQPPRHGKRRKISFI